MFSLPVVGVAPPPVGWDKEIEGLGEIRLEGRGLGWVAQFGERRAIVSTPERALLLLETGGVPEDPAQAAEATALLDTLEGALTHDGPRPAALAFSIGAPPLRGEAAQVRVTPERLAVDAVTSAGRFQALYHASSPDAGTWQQGAEEAAARLGLAVEKIADPALRTAATVWLAAREAGDRGEPAARLALTKELRRSPPAAAALNGGDRFTRALTAGLGAEGGGDDASRAAARFHARLASFGSLRMAASPHVQAALWREVCAAAEGGAKAATLDDLVRRVREPMRFPDGSTAILGEDGVTTRPAPLPAWETDPAPADEREGWSAERWLSRGGQFRVADPGETRSDAFEPALARQMIVLLPAELREQTVKETRAAATDQQTPREVRRLLSNGLFLLIETRDRKPATPAAKPASDVAPQQPAKPRDRGGRGTD